MIISPEFCNNLLKDHEKWVEEQLKKYRTKILETCSMKNRVNIEDLRIDQIVWHNGQARQVDFLRRVSSERSMIGFYGDDHVYQIEDEDITLSPPAPKRMASRYKVRNLETGEVYITDTFYTEDGSHTNKAGYNANWINSFKHEATKYGEEIEVDF